MSFFLPDFKDEGRKRCMLRRIPSYTKAAAQDEGSFPRIGRTEAAKIPAFVGSRRKLLLGRGRSISQGYEAGEESMRGSMYAEGFVAR